ncbi:zinc finger protein 260-like [Trichogramma pretiosum]|uniref:zinc finger protein 260-like n=1 Tax=Trichogramma pretiosum TaxID=7493 RepID=UPI0006C9924C|nr:zinc finger protein 260-like [Trichogramma pretiosum]
MTANGDNAHGMTQAPSKADLIINQHCRLCARIADRLVGIFETEGRQHDVQSKIEKCLRIQISTADSLPQAICYNCLKILNQSNDFYIKSNDAQLLLKKVFLESEKSLKKNTSFTDSNNHTSSIFLPEFKDCSSDDSRDNHNDNMSNYSLNNTDIENNENIGDQDVKNQKIARKVKRKNNENKTNCIKEDKKNRKRPDNYMTGTDSDMEMLISTEKKPSNLLQKSGTKKREKQFRYPWLCTDCNEKLPSLETLNEHHKNIHNQDSKFMCVLCCKIYNKYYGFLAHVKKHKNLPQYSCDECDRMFVHKKVLETHKAIHSNERPFICSTCGKSFKQQSALYTHSRCHLPEDKKNKYPCDQCDKKFSTKPNLITHKRIHAGIRNFTCDQCGKSFIQKGNLEAHFLTHSAEKPFSCSECPKSFKTSLLLKKHITVHTGAKPHECNVCGKTFREKGTLREHERIHTGEMPFSCEFCGKSFRFKGILTTHRRQHTGERPYSCQECQHHFTNWPNYNKHMKRRHGIDTSGSKKKLKNKTTQENLQSSQSMEINESVTSQPCPIIVQVIQAVPHVTMAQSIVLQTDSSNSATTAQTYAEPNEILPTIMHDTYQQRPIASQNYGGPPLATFMQTYSNLYSVSEANNTINHR